MDQCSFVAHISTFNVHRYCHLKRLPELSFLLTVARCYRTQFFTLHISCILFQYMKLSVISNATRTVAEPNAVAADACEEKKLIFEFHIFNRILSNLCWSEKFAENSWRKHSQNSASSKNSSVLLIWGTKIPYDVWHINRLAPAHWTYTEEVFQRFYYFLRNTCSLSKRIAALCPMLHAGENVNILLSAFRGIENGFIKRHWYVRMALMVILHSVNCCRTCTEHGYCVTSFAIDGHVMT